MHNSREIIVLSSEQVLRRTVLVAPSMNLEHRGSVSSTLMDELIAQSDGVIVRGQKTPVAGLVIYDATRGGKMAEITLPSGHRLRVALTHGTSEVTAGSAANIGNALIEFNREDTGIVSAAGKGGGRDALMRSLANRGLTDLLLFRRRGGTARSLILAEENGTATIVSYKPPYAVSPETLAMVRERVQARVVVCTGFLAYELPLVEAILTAPGVGEATVLSPHVGCFETEEGKKKFLELAAQADLAHMNQFELGRLLGYADDWKLPADDQPEFAEFAKLGQRLGSRLLCITLAEEGSITYERGRHRVIRQKAFQVETVRNTVGAGDVHLAAMIYYLWLRQRRPSLQAALEVTARICAAKIQFQNAEAPRPWDGIPQSEARKPWIHGAMEHYPVVPMGGG